MITIDMTKARDIWRGKIREARAEKFAELDVAFMRAVERQDLDAQKRIADEKQVLRDMTKDPAIEAAKTVDELKAFWPL